MYICIKLPVKQAAMVGEKGILLDKTEGAWYVRLGYNKTSLLEEKGEGGGGDQRQSEIHSSRD